MRALLGTFIFSIGIGPAFAAEPVVDSAKLDPADKQAEQTGETEEPEEEQPSFWSRFKDPEDGKFDIVAGGKGASGFLPLAVPFNDPTVGVGLAFALAYFHPSEESGNLGPGVQKRPPTTTFGGGAASTNGTRALAAGHHHVWKQGKIRYLGAFASTSANLDFYGLGSGGSEDSFSFNVEGAGLIQQGEFKIGKSDFFAGVKYIYFSSESRFDEEGLEEFEIEIDDAAVGLFVNYDTRDTTFTPNRGTRASLGVSVSSETFGGDLRYVRTGLELRHYWPIGERVSFGARFDYSVAGVEAPFYSLPFIRLRGIPAFRYLGQHVVTAEIEPRFRIDGRWSVVAFAGAGRAGTDLDDMKEADRAYNLGAGFRYLIARKLGLATGLDVARGPDEWAGYIIVGSAW